MIKEKLEPQEKLEAEALPEKLGKMVLRVPEELEVLWSVFGLFPELSHCGWKIIVSSGLKVSSCDGLHREGSSSIETNLPPRDVRSCKHSTVLK